MSGKETEPVAIVSALVETLHRQPRLGEPDTLGGFQYVKVCEGQLVFPSLNGNLWCYTMQEWNNQIVCYEVLFHEVEQENPKVMCLVCYQHLV